MMNPPIDHNPGPRLSLPLRLLLALPFLLVLQGCPGTRTVNKTVIAPHLMDATLEQLITRVNTQFNAVQSFSATVEIASTTGGAHSGTVTENPTLAGYILLRKPADLHVIMLAPIIRSRAMDMVSDGKTFKLFYSILGKTKAVEGPDAITTPSKNGLENLRPNIIRDAMLVPAVPSEEFAALDQNSRLLAPAKGRKEAIEEPDYDVVFLRNTQDHVLEHVRTIHISRITLLPYEQDIFDATGHIVTVVTYDKYQKFGDIDFPMSIHITRPLDEYTLNIEISKLSLNQKLDDDQFALEFPANVTVQKMP